MDRTLIKKYIDNQPQKIVTKMDLDKGLTDTLVTC